MVSVACDGTIYSDFMITSFEIFVVEMVGSNFMGLKQVLELWHHVAGTGDDLFTMINCIIEITMYNC